MPQESAVQDMIDAVNGCYLAMRKEAALMNNEVVSEQVDTITALESKQDECEENFRQAQEYVQQWQRSLTELKTIREVNIRRADVLQAWTRAVREQLPGLAAVPSVAQAPPPPIEWVQRHQYATGVASPGTGARTVSFHSHASAPSENPQVLRDVINSAAATATASSQARPATATPKRAPRQLVTKSELEQCSSYLVGRWTQQKINLAIEELAGFAEHNAKQMAALKSKVSSFKSSEARKRMLDLAAVAKVNPRMQSHFWFLESDLKDGSILKCDRSGKGLLQLLRHLKRFSEVRCKVRNEADIVYIYEA